LPEEFDEQLIIWTDGMLNILALICDLGMTRIVILFLFTTIMLACQNKQTEERRITRIGRDLVSLDTTINRPVQTDIVNIGNGLRDKLKEVKSKATSYQFKMSTGDLDEPYGNGQADCILTIDTNATDLAVRLKYNSDVDKYHILGWMTLNQSTD